MINLKHNVLIVLAILAFSSCHEKSPKTELNIDGYWQLTNSTYDYSQALQQMNCPDGEALALYDPYALGPHILIEGDSISFFRYPFEYYKTVKYEIIEDSLFVNLVFANSGKFSIQRTTEESLLLDFIDDITSTCQAYSKAKYERFIPDTTMINKLYIDSISYSSLAGKWWYLKKESSSEDGSEPFVYNFPEGMPDSIFVSNEVISQNVKHPFVELELENRMVKLFFQDPAAYSVSLLPETIEDKMLFSHIWEYEYSGRLDTFYYDIVFNNWE